MYEVLCNECGSGVKTGQGDSVKQVFYLNFPSDSFDVPWPSHGRRREREKERERERKREREGGREGGEGGRDEKMEQAKKGSQIVNISHPPYRDAILVPDCSTTQAAAQSALAECFDASLGMSAGFQEFPSSFQVSTFPGKEPAYLCRTRQIHALWCIPLSTGYDLSSQMGRLHWEALVIPW